mmetsp:Transcript_66883/g.175357  ORF Transcript_66883/g.175357 Transcript_66883/m.175357 type:complete len:377 (+) Transcript_66883:496-1626(+)
MVARADAVAHLLRQHHGTDGQAAGERLGQSHEVRRHPGDLVGPQVAGASEPALHLVEDEHGADLVALLPERLHELRGGRDHATLTLHRLHEDCAHCVVDLRQGLDLVEGEELDRLHDRLEGFLVVILVGEREGTHRPAVEAVVESDELLAGLPLVEVELTGELDGGLVCLRARVAEERLVGEGQRNQLLSKRNLLGVQVEVRGVDERGRLLLRHLDPARVPVPQAVHGDAGAEVQVLLALGVEEVVALAADHRQAALAVVVEEDAVSPRLQVRGGALDLLRGRRVRPRDAGGALRAPPPPASLGHAGHKRGSGAQEEDIPSLAGCGSPGLGVGNHPRRGRRRGRRGGWPVPQDAGGHEGCHLAGGFARVGRLGGGL